MFHFEWHARSAKLKLIENVWFILAQKDYTYQHQVSDLNEVADVIMKV